MKISITENDILLAVRRNSHRCMIADAIKRDVEHATRIVVDLQSIRWTDEAAGIRYFFFTPPVAQEALLAFDQGKEVKPFEFQLVKPAQIRPQGFDADLRSTREKDPDEPKRQRRSAPTESEQGSREVKRQSVARKRAQVRLRDTEREFGICRMKDHPLQNKGEGR